jgi:hypothetical protein
MGWKPMPRGTAFQAVSRLIMRSVTATLTKQDFMQKREKILAAVAGGLVLAVGGNYVYGKLQDAYSQRTGQIESLSSRLQDKEFEIAKGLRARKQLNAWTKTSLPANSQLAATLYQNYLVGLLDEIGLDQVDVAANRPVSRGGVYQLLAFNIRAQGSLPQVTDFLYRFYQAGHLHQIASLSAKPIENSKLDINIKIEALSLTKADQQDELSETPSDRLVWTELEDYQQAIGRRNLFAHYTPPPPPPRETPRPPPPPPFNAAKFAVVSAIIEIDERPQVWVNVRTSGEMLKRHEGEDLEVGLFKGKITRIDGQSVEIESGGERKVVALGESLQ